MLTKRAISSSIVEVYGLKGAITIGNVYLLIIMATFMDAYIQMIGNYINGLIIGEYGNVWENNRWKQLAYVYFSSDNGETWERSDYLIGQGINKHVHMVK